MIADGILAQTQNIGIVDGIRAEDFLGLTSKGELVSPLRGTLLARSRPIASKAGGCSSSPAVC